MHLQFASNGHGHVCPACRKEKALLDGRASRYITKAFVLVDSISFHSDGRLSLSQDWTGFSRTDCKRVFKGLEARFFSDVGLATAFKRIRKKEVD